MSTRITRLIVVCSVLVVVGLVGTTGSRQELPVSAGSSVTPFRERVAGYSRLRQQLITYLLARGVDPNAGHGVEFRNQLGLAIREARRAAQPGEIFCMEVAGPMRQLVWTTLRGEDEILADVPAVASVRVNDFYPEGQPLATVPPSLLQQFEPLPPELQYRFLATELILLDIDTALIVDFIPNAFQRSSTYVETH